MCGNSWIVPDEPVVPHKGVGFDILEGTSWAFEALPPDRLRAMEKLRIGASVLLLTRLPATTRTVHSSDYLIYWNRGPYIGLSPGAM
jgi:hypothetical protein